MKRYRASGRIPLGGFLLMIIAVIVGSLIAGGLAFGVSKFIYLIVLFPLVMGVIGGAVMAWAVKRGKVRSPFIAILFGLVVGVGIIATYRFLDYYFTFLPDARTSILEEAGEAIPQDELDAFIDEVLEAETDSTGFLGYLKFTAQQGTTITQRSSDLTLDETATWVYWGIELVIVMLIAAGMAAGAAREPFNEEADEWYPPETYMGSVDWKSRKEFYKLLNSGDTINAFRMVGSEPTTPPRVDLAVQRTLNTPQADVILLVKETRLNRRQEVSANKMKGVLTPAAFSELSRRLSSMSTATPTTLEESLE